MQSVTWQLRHTADADTFVEAGDPETLERELLPFKKIKDNYTKMLLTMDLVPEEFDGVKKINVVDWLLGKNRG